MNIAVTVYVKRIHGAFELVSARGFVLFTLQDIGQLFYNKRCICVFKIRWKLPLVGFSYDKKSANVVMWKDKEYE